ncbi:MAG TPA: lipocalin family protein [Candidatus Bacteroides pullicola]|uniref:Lipocalin family protein n=1 Tax=Candidatus Bacteroides pullicola TaxID=2838475 RepID=A0A9D1ZI63_9BACE|nr:lipocalin family protein [Candidatus Bacteroides pullicola]
MKTKQLLWLCGLLMTFAFGFTSCSEDDGPGSTDSLLVGLWKGESYEYWLTADGKIKEHNTISNDDRQLRFNADGTAMTYVYQNGSWEIAVEYTWIYEGGKLTCEADAGDDVFDVKSLTSSELVLEHISDRRVVDGVVYEVLNRNTFRKVDE